MKNRRFLLVSASLFIASVAVAQTGGDDAVSVVNSEKSGDYPIHVSGSIQSDILIPQKDEKIGAKDYDEWALTNTYAEVNAQSEYVDAGARFEFLEHPLPGFEKDLKGWGVPYFYVNEMGYDKICDASALTRILDLVGVCKTIEDFNFRLDEIKREFMGLIDSFV